MPDLIGHLFAQSTQTPLCPTLSLIPGSTRDLLPPDPCRPPVPPPSKSASNDGTLLFECISSVMPSAKKVDVNYFLLC